MEISLRQSWGKGIEATAVLVVIMLCLFSQIFHMSSTTRATLAVPSIPIVLNEIESNNKSSLPPTFRVADTHSCRPPSTAKIAGSLVSDSATPISQRPPKIQNDMAVKLALGGYQNIRKGSGDIPQAGPLLMLLSKVQMDTFGLLGSVAELGVHHGRFTAFLFATARRDEDLVVVDLFEEMQQFNIDRSGSGNKQKFLQGMQLYGLGENDLHTLHMGSTQDLPFDWSRQAQFAPLRLISVDAGHTAELALNDLQIAFCNLLPGGVVILDDFFHGQWPGVSEAFFRLLFQTPEALASVSIYPFLACKSKLFLTNSRDAYEAYYAELSQATDLVQPYGRENSLHLALNGIEYLRCITEDIEDESIQKRWASLIF